MFSHAANRSGTFGTATIAIRIASVGRANAILSEWRRDVLFPGLVETRLLRIESVSFAAVLFP